MSVRIFNVPSTAPPVVPVLCPSLELDAPPQNPESTVGLHRKFLGDGDGKMPSGSRIPFPLDQGTAYGRDDRSAFSAAAQVIPVVGKAPLQVSVSASFLSAGAQLRRLRCFFFFFFFFPDEWEHRMGTMCPFSSLHPSRIGKERQ